MRLTAIAIWMPVVLCTACAAKAPTHFLLLDPVGAAPTASVGPATPVQVGKVQLPSALDREELVRSSAAGEVDVISDHRWAAPLAPMVRRVLSQDLASRLPAGSVLMPDQPASVETLVLVLELTEFLPDAKGGVSLQGVWSLLPGKGTAAIASQPVRVTLKGSGGNIDGEVQAMDRALGVLADDIVAQLPLRKPPAASRH